MINPAVGTCIGFQIILANFPRSHPQVVSPVKRSLIFVKLFVQTAACPFLTQIDESFAIFYIAIIRKKIIANG